MTMTKPTENQLLLEKLLAEHKLSEEAKAEQRMKDFFANCKIPVPSQKLIRDSYNVYKKLK